MIIHKYVKPDGIDILENLRLKAGDPAKQNDPFELLWAIQGEAVSSMFGKKKIENLADIYCRGGKLELSERKKFVEGCLKDPDKIVQALNEKFLPIAKDYTKEMRNEAKQFFMIVCFSAQIEDAKNEILVWSHYTKDHEGMRIHFETDLFPPGWRASLHQIKYRRKRAAILLNDLLFSKKKIPQMIGKSLERKSTAWKYENEYRLFLNPAECFRDDDQSLDFVSIDPQIIRRIDLGVNAVALRNHVVELVTKNPKLSHIQIRISQVDDNEFKLNYMKV